MFAVTANGWRKTPANKSRGPYAADRDQWVGYDDPSSAAAKAEYIAESGFGGAALWTADLDDFNNLCCLGPNPVTRAVSSVLRGVHSSPPVSGCGRPPPVVTPEPFIPTTTTFDWGGEWATTERTKPKPRPPKKEPEDVDLVERPPPQYPDAEQGSNQVSYNVKFFLPCDDAGHDSRSRVRRALFNLTNLIANSFIVVREANLW